MIVRLLTKHHLEFQSLKGGCRGWSDSTLVKMSNCWKSHAAAQIFHVYLILKLNISYAKSSLIPLLPLHDDHLLQP